MKSGRKDYHSDRMTNGKGHQTKQELILRPSHEETSPVGHETFYISITNLVKYHFKIFLNVNNGNELHHGTEIL